MPVGWRLSEWSVTQRGSCQPAIEQRDQAGAEGADGRCLGGREDAAIDAADHGDENQKYRPDSNQAAEALGIGCALR